MTSLFKSFPSASPWTAPASLVPMVQLTVEPLTSHSWPACHIWSSWHPPMKSSWSIWSPRRMQSTTDQAHSGIWCYRSIFVASFFFLLLWSLRMCVKETCAHCLGMMLLYMLMYSSFFLSKKLWEENWALTLSFFLSFKNVLVAVNSRTAVVRWCMTDPPQESD